jgi:hypothetical protein
LILGRWIGAAVSSPHVHEYDVDLDPGDIPACQIDLFENVAIIDGLSAIPSGSEDPGPDPSCVARIASICLDEEVLPHTLDLALLDQFAVHSLPALLDAAVEEGALELVLPAVRNSGLASAKSLAVQTGSYWFFKRNLPVRTDTLRLLKAPYLRRSLKLESMQLREMEGFLREAARLRGVRQGNGEVLAVFTRVPIELVADYRYIAEKQLLLYTLALDRRSLTTRIHDLAAVREKTTGKTYLVADPSRYRTAVLN